MARPIVRPNASLPSPPLLRCQAEWLAPARARLLRRVAIARRRSVLDLGAGHGAVVAELVRRCGGEVVALDKAWEALRGNDEAFAGALRVCGNATHLPFAPGAFDLVFAQCAFLWMPAEQVIREVWRVLQQDGVLVALEPDYGGMVEHPPAIATRDLWIPALQRAGADPFIGRRLPSLLAEQGFQVRVDWLSRLLPPEPARFDLLRDLPLTASEREALRRIEEADARLTGEWAKVVHLPFFLITATKVSPSPHRA